MAQGIARPDANKAVEDGGNLEILAGSVTPEQDSLTLILVELRLLNLQMKTLTGIGDDLDALRSGIMGETI